MQDFEQGGLRMIHLENYINALKLGWVRRLLLNDSRYKLLFQSIYVNVESLLIEVILTLKKSETTVEISFGTMY